MFESARRGLADLDAALKLKNVWWALASEDIADAHRRTMLGPVWPLLNYLLFVGALVLVLGSGAGSVNFAAYVASGMLVWLFINDVMSMSVTLFTREAGFIKGTVLPVSVYVLRQSMVIAIRSFYALLGAIPILLYNGMEFTPALLSVPLAILLLLLAAPAVAVLFGIGGIYFPDLQFVVVNATRLLMFITPVFWVHHDMGGMLSLLYYWNPLTHYIEILRTPVVEGVVPVNSWVVTLPLTAFLLVSALFALGRFNRRIVFQL
jgi:ABC-type polysaccharide/polyol phosphate export permease